MANSDIKNYCKSRGVRLWQLAAKLGINDNSFSRKLRKEFSNDEKLRAFKFIDQISDEMREEAQ